MARETQGASAGAGGVTDNGSASRGLLAEAIGCSLAEIGADASIETMPVWDSLAHMRIVLALEDKLGRELGPEEIIAIVSLADIARILDGEAG
jgi:acyl carrier protein